MDHLRWLTRFLLTLLGVLILVAVFAAAAQASIPGVGTDPTIISGGPSGYEDGQGGATMRPTDACTAIAIDVFGGGDGLHYFGAVYTIEAGARCQVWYREDSSKPWVLPNYEVAYEMVLSPQCPERPGLLGTPIWVPGETCQFGDANCPNYAAGAGVHYCIYKAAHTTCASLEGADAGGVGQWGTGVGVCATVLQDDGVVRACGAAWDAAAGGFKFTGTQCGTDEIPVTECGKLPGSATGYVALGTASGGSAASGPSTWASGPAAVSGTVCSGQCRYTVGARTALVYPSGWSGAGTTQVAGRYNLSNQGTSCTGSEGAEAGATPGFTPSVVQGTISAPTGGNNGGNNGGASSPTTGSAENEAAWGNYGHGGSSSGSGSATGSSSGSGSGAVAGSTSAPSGSASSCTQQPCDGWGGTCESGFQCTGDPVQCAQAQAAYSVACSLRTDPNNVAVKEAGEALAAAGSSPDGGWGAQGETKTFALSEFIAGRSYGPDGGGCVSDFSVSALGRTFVIPFSEYCPVLNGLGLAGNGLTMVIAIGIVFGGRRSAS